MMIVENASYSYPSIVNKATTTNNYIINSNKFNWWWIANGRFLFWMMIVENASYAFPSK